MAPRSENSGSRRCSLVNTERRGSIARRQQSPLIRTRPQIHRRGSSIEKYRTMRCVECNLRGHRTVDCPRRRGFHGRNDTLSGRQREALINVGLLEVFENAIHGNRTNIVGLSFADFVDGKSVRSAASSESSSEGDDDNGSENVANSCSTLRPAVQSHSSDAISTVESSVDSPPFCSGALQSRDDASQFSGRFDEDTSTVESYDCENDSADDDPEERVYRHEDTPFSVRTPTYTELFSPESEADYDWIDI